MNDKLFICLLVLFGLWWFFAGPENSISLGKIPQPATTSTEQSADSASIRISNFHPPFPIKAKYGKDTTRVAIDLDCSRCKDTTLYKWYGDATWKGVKIRVRLSSTAWGNKYFIGNGYPIPKGCSVKNVKPLPTE